MTTVFVADGNQMNNVKCEYNSLEDFLRSKPLDIDGLLNDGGGAVFPVKGRMLDAAVLFADVSKFSSRVAGLSPIEILIFANNFFAWISAEALRGGPGIVDKYIGDEVMVVFANELGSEDPFLDAVRAARCMAERDDLGFCPHIGLAAGRVVVGYVGTPLKYDCSVYGSTVNIARACCRIPQQGQGSSSIIVPADLWQNRTLEVIFPKRKIDWGDGETSEEPLDWEDLPARKEKLKTGQEIEIVEIALKSSCLPALSAEAGAQKAFDGLKKDGWSFRPRRYGSETVPSCFKK